MEQTEAQADALQLFPKGKSGNRHGAGLTRARSKQLLEQLLADFGTVTVADRLILQQVANLLARSERVSVGTDEAIRLASTAHRLINSLRRRSGPSRRARDGADDIGAAMRASLAERTVDRADEDGATDTADSETLTSGDARPLGMGATDGALCSHG